MLMKDEYTLYIILCNDKTLYTGIAKDLEKRLLTHSKGTGSKYVRGRLPFALIYTEKLPNRAEATKRELKIKKMSRNEKIINLKLKLV